MVLTLTLRESPSLPVEVEGLTPDWSRSKSLSQIEQFEVFHGNRKQPVREFFSVEGDPSDGTMIFRGDLRNIHWLGAHMTTGEVRVEGHAGRHVGSQMRGGVLTVTGDCRDYAGTEMRGGLLRIHGNAGILTGGAYRGSTRGMTGGTILVHGNSGDECGALMRRGLIAVAGHCGDFPGYHMIAGTLAILGTCGRHPGAGMKRGTIAILGPSRPLLLPSFQFSSRMPLQSHSIMLHHLKSLGLPLPNDVGTSLDIFRGDKVSLGLGEVLLSSQEKC